MLRQHPARPGRLVDGACVPPRSVTALGAARGRSPPSPSDIPTPRSTPMNAPIVPPMAAPARTTAAATPMGHPTTRNTAPTTANTAAPITAPATMPLPARPPTYRSARRSADCRGSDSGRVGTSISTPSIPWCSSASIVARASSGDPNSAMSITCDLPAKVPVKRGTVRESGGRSSAELGADDADERHHLARGSRRGCA